MNMLERETDGGLQHHGERVKSEKLLQHLGSKMGDVCSSVCVCVRVLIHLFKYKTHSVILCKT